MPTLPTILPIGDSSVGSWTTDSGGTTNLWQKIDEGIAGATDTSDFVKGPADVNSTDYKVNLATTPSDFNSIKTLSWQIRFALSGTPPSTSKDTYGISLRIMSGATVLASADSAGTFQSVVSTTTMATTFSNSAVTAFTYVNPTATKTQWDAAVLEIRQTYTQTGTKDAHSVEVSAVQCTGTYNVIMAATTSAISITPTTTGLKSSRILSAAVSSISLASNSTNLKASKLLTATVSNILLAPNATNLKVSRLVTSIVSNIIITANTINLKTSRLLAAVYSIILTSGSINLIVSRFTTITVSSISLAVNTANLIVSRLVSITVANIIITANTSNLKKNYSLAPTSQSYVINSNTTGLHKGYMISINQSNIIVSYNSTGFIRSRKLSPSTATYVIGSNNTNLNYSGAIITTSHGNLFFFFG